MPPSVLDGPRWKFIGTARGWLRLDALLRCDLARMLVLCGAGSEQIKAPVAFAIGRFRSQSLWGRETTETCGAIAGPIMNYLKETVAKRKAELKATIPDLEKAGSKTTWEACLRE